MLTFALFWNIEAAPISNQTHITSAIFNTSSSNLHQCVQNDQPIIFNEVYFKYFSIK